MKLSEPFVLKNNPSRESKYSPNNKKFSGDSDKSQIIGSHVHHLFFWEPAKALVASQNFWRGIVALDDLAKMSEISGGKIFN